ncbi:hypothetical protein D934_09890 [Xylella fastidiosa subsp. sandyi Ann-1]|uniref:Uncharacterized protein n=1 Tax=Xylella fastidiosa subsp. sandyi Ann-1 TaxID=155920 RepID=A0A060H403_XYLFS|nr:hypothetical protein D934_09890 [Xylella fastidiosa subsp. sandyi Ann-1]
MTLDNSITVALPAHTATVQPHQVTSFTHAYALLMI